MSGRIALMVRGLPSIGIDEMASKFGKYYPSHKSEVFHTSESFQKAMSDPSGSIAFTDKNGNIQGGGGLTKQSIGDLRQLEKDFDTYISNNPNVYTNSPTTPSRAKLYRRQGFQGESFQVLDARRIAEDDVPYVKALDSSMLDDRVNAVLGNTSPSGFFKMPDGTVRSLERFKKYGSVEQVMSGKYSEDALKDMLTKQADNSLAYSISNREGVSARNNRRSSVEAQIRRDTTERNLIEQQRRDEQTLAYDRQYRPQVRIPWQESQGLVPRITLNSY